MQIHDKLTLLSLSKRRDLLFVMNGAGGGRVSQSYCGECMLRLMEQSNLKAEVIQLLNITSEARLNHACHNCERNHPDRTYHF